GTVTAGVSLESGQTDLNGVQIKFQGQRPYSTAGALTMSLNHTHGTTKPPGEPERFTVANRLEGHAGIEHNYGERLVMMLRTHGLRDPIAHIDYRVEQLLGLGVRMNGQRVHVRVIPGLSLLHHDKNIGTENGFNTNYG